MLSTAMMGPHGIDACAAERWRGDNGKEDPGQQIFF